MKDFFRSYHAARLRSYGLPVVCAVFISLGLVSLTGSRDMQFLQADVLGGTQQNQQNTADLILDRTDGNITLHMGKNADKVDLLTFTILGDPTKFTALTSRDPRVQIFTNEPGISLVKIALSSADLHTGEKITDLTATLASGSTLSVTDASFVSQGTSYNLSVQGK